MYFAQRPIFEHSVSGIGKLPSHQIYPKNIKKNFLLIFKASDMNSLAKLFLLCCRYSKCCAQLLLLHSGREK